MAHSQKQYTLMHKDIPVADMTIDEATGGIVKVTAIHNPAHLPVGVGIMKNNIDRRALNDWWKGRSIPASRLGLKDALLDLGVSHTELLIEKCLGLSLSDQYWIRPLGSPISWAEVNFFDNPFSEDVGQILFGQRTTSDRISLMSPDNTSDGWLKKKWTIIDGKRYLLKSGSGATQQEPYNEVLASCIMERLHIPHVPYHLVMQDGYPYSLCEDFITAQTELISAWHILQTQKRPNHISLYQHYVDCAEALGIPGVVPALDQMLVVDYLIANEDRHLNNFGVVRDAEALSYRGAAPIYDSGTSLWFDRPTTMIRDGVRLICKPFKNDHEEQIRLVSSFDWLDLSALDDIEEEWAALVQGSDFIDENRRDAIGMMLRKRISALQDKILHREVCISGHDLSNEVKEDVRYSGA